MKRLRITQLKSDDDPWFFYSSSFADFVDIAVYLNNLSSIDVINSSNEDTFIIDSTYSTSAPASASAQRSDGSDSISTDFRSEFNLDDAGQQYDLITEPLVVSDAVILSFTIVINHVKDLVSALQR